LKPNSEELLEALAEQARADADADGLGDARLQAVIRGSASRGERRALQDEAREAGIDVATLEAALRPMRPEARARVHELAARELVTGGSSGAPPASDRGVPSRGATGAATGAATVSELPRRWTVIIGGLALAAALALFVVTRGDGEVRVAAIPSYEVTVTGGRAAERGAPEAVALVPGARVVISLRPATPVEGPVEARAFLVRGAQRVPLELKATATAEGAVRLEGTLADLGPEWVGDAEVVASIARAGISHEPLDAVVAGRQVVRAAVVVKAREAR